MAVKAVVEQAVCDQQLLQLAAVVVKDPVQQLGVQVHQVKGLQAAMEQTLIMQAVAVVLVLSVQMDQAQLAEMVVQEVHH